MKGSRRAFLKTVGAVGASAGIPSLVHALNRGGANPSHIVVASSNRAADPDFYTIAQKAIDAAMSAGATYADVRYSIERDDRVKDMYYTVNDDEWFGVGVRAFVNGYWGFVGSAVLSADEMIRLGRESVLQAKANSGGVPSDLKLSMPPQPVKNGEWTMPVKYDPFDISKGEKLDFLRAYAGMVYEFDNRSFGGAALHFKKKKQYFMSSEGSSFCQTTFYSDFDLGLSYTTQMSIGAADYGMHTAVFSTPVGKGWEYILDMDMYNEIGNLVEETKATRFQIETKINRYDAVITANALSSILDYSMGAATEADRVLGYEANASGTSYLYDVDDALGLYEMGNNKLNVVADRTMEGGLATVKWDDEGVTPQPFNLVSEGKLTDLQTNRETASYLANYYAKSGREVKSNGCAASQSGMFITTQHTSNIRMVPSSEERSFEQLLGGIENGIAIVRIKGLEVDQQQLNAIISADVREVSNGKMGAYMSGAALMIRAPEFWKSLVEIGGPSSARQYGFTRTRGQPAQSYSHTVSAVPATFKNIGLIDMRRR